MSGGSLKSLRTAVDKLERDYLDLYTQRIAILTSDEFMVEFLRVVTQEAGSFTVEEVEEFIVGTGGNMDEWRPVLDKALGQCVRVSKGRRPGATRYRYLLPTG
jgi:hypothetical protein